jgi:hypothetical protein
MTTLSAEKVAFNEAHFLFAINNARSYTWAEHGETFAIKNRRMVAQTERGYIMLGKIVSKDFMFNYVQPPADTKRDLWELLYPTRSFKCVLCNKNSKGYGNNAKPLCEGRCCDKCNYGKVLPRRIAEKQVEGLAKTSGDVGKLAKEKNENLIGMLELLVKRDIEDGGNGFELEYNPKGDNKDEASKVKVVIPPKALPELAPNKMKTLPPQSDDELARLFKNADLKGVKAHKKHQSKSKIEAKQEAEETRLANIALQEERKRRKDFEKEVAEKAKIPKRK